MAVWIRRGLRLLAVSITVGACTTSPLPTPTQSASVTSPGRPESLGFTPPCRFKVGDTIQIRGTNVEVPSPGHSVFVNGSGRSSVNLITTRGEWLWSWVRVGPRLNVSSRPPQPAPDDSHAHPHR